MLICIPDISGFTQFMSETDSDLTSKVIPALLNKIIYSNKIGLKVSEIEGDAVLFYRSGKLPSLNILIDQCIIFYKEFYKQLYSLKDKHSYSDDSHKIPRTLGLKIILHYGNDIETVQIGKHIKLMGEDVIIAHKLLKNKVPKDEYLLMSENLLAQYNMKELDNKTYWGNLKTGENVYEHLGEINYTYIDFEPLLNNK
ncbi:DUF2652 domain-containing protein [Flaviramulus sp. BrNp1-15]|uniref:DUF2652 domain-containing protein n=1 Tax=Flaviramulus sp. BrNp1-15 TaxID=2916754 RepID=UPI001EE8414D|nr:DUF2652 domain-containing protein [Flaviramulus sp. BrNp1-15]ULC59127.1 DUF2652 domain-containing protein [Flaviramulus sp. BrNp1-15]